MLLKKCPKCRGDLYVEHYLGDEDEWVCLQCGYILIPQLAVALVAPLTNPSIADIPRPRTGMSPRAKRVVVKRRTLRSLAHRVSRRDSIRRSA